VRCFDRGSVGTDGNSGHELSRLRLNARMVRNIISDTQVARLDSGLSSCDEKEREISWYNTQEE
jgi:hypothetical protein